MATVPDLGTVPRLFDRPRRDHPWLRAFEELERTEATRRAVCQNWRMDHRVSEGREQQMTESDELAGELEGEAWWRRRAAHFRRTLCQPTFAAAGGWRSAYLEAANQGNKIERARIPAHEQLIHAGSWNAILARLATGEHPTGRIRRRFPELTGVELPRRPWHTGADAAAEVDAAAEAANGLEAPAFRELVGLLVEGLGPTQPPWWAGFAQELLPFVRRGHWTELAQSLGMGHLAAGEWLLVWRYPAATVYQLGAGVGLYRPTVVEANDSAWHFPSPPGLAHGITMPLALGRQRACREVVHPDTAAWLDRHPMTTTS